MYRRSSDCRCPATGYNGLAVTNDGTAAFAVQQGFTNGSPILVYRLNVTTGATTADTRVGLLALLLSLASLPVTGTGAVGGALNPVTGIYYVYYSTGSGGFDLYAFNTNTNAGIGRVGSVTGFSTTGGNGDIAFDSQGRLYALASITTAGTTQLGVLNQTVPTTAGSSALTVTVVSNPATGSSFNGVTFDADGYLYLTTNATAPGVLYTFDPNSGASVGTPTTVTGGGTANTVDAADCAYPPVLSLRANVGGRMNTRARLLPRLRGLQRHRDRPACPVRPLRPPRGDQGLSRHLPGGGPVPYGGAGVRP